LAFNHKEPQEKHHARHRHLSLVRKQAEEAARYYVSVFKNAKMGNISHYPDTGQETHGQQAGSVLVAEFSVDGRNFVCLNGGPQFKFTEAVSHDPLQGPEGDRLLLGQVRRRWRPGRTLRLAEGQVWSFLADLPEVMLKLLTDPTRRRSSA